MGAEHLNSRATQSLYAMTQEGKILRLVENARQELSYIMLKRISNNEKLKMADNILLHVAREIQLILKESAAENFDSNGTAT